MFNFVFREVALAVIYRSVPLLSLYFDQVYGRETHHLLGWRDSGKKSPDGAGSTPTPTPHRQKIPAGRGAQQGDSLGPLLHAAAQQLLLWRLGDTLSKKLLQVYHDEVVFPRPISSQKPIMREKVE